MWCSAPIDDCVPIGNNIRMATPSFGVILRDLRLDAQLTLTELAARSGVSRPYLSRLEAGEREPSFAVACALAHALGVCVEIFDQTHEPESK